MGLAQKGIGRQSEMGEIDDAQKLDFGMQLKSKGLNKMIAKLFNQIPEKPRQRTYQKHLRRTLRIVLANLSSTDDFISYSRNDHAEEYQSSKYSAKNMRKVADFLATGGLVENKRGFYTDDRSQRRVSRMRCLIKLRRLFSENGVGSEMIKTSKTRNLIVLRDEKKRDMSYDENDFTITARSNVEDINELLSNHFITYGNGKDRLGIRIDGSPVVSG